MLDVRWMEGHFIVAVSQIITVIEECWLEPDMQLRK